MSPTSKLIARVLIGSVGFELAPFGYEIMQQQYAAAAYAATKQHKQHKRNVARRRHLPSIILCPGDPRCPPIQPPG